MSYKIISKILCLRLKETLDIVISESQAGFVPGRIIHDNVLVAHEFLHALKSKKDCAEQYMAIKTDISKAYDRVEWNFLEDVMKKLGFVTIWIHWIMTCVRSASYSVLINGSPFGNILPTRGIRQGDSVSVFILIVCRSS